MARLSPWLLAAAAVGGALAYKRRARRRPKRVCGPLGARGRLGGVEYRSWTPASKVRGPLILFHGRGGSEDQMFGMMASVKLGALQIYPRGLVPFGSNAAWTRARSTDPEFESELRSALPYVAKMVAEVARCHGKPLVAGHSQGAHIAYALASEYPELVRGAVGASGTLPEGFWGTRFAVPVTAIHGTDDQTVPYDRTAAMVEAKGGKLVTVDTGHGYSGALRREFESALTSLPA